MSFWFLVSLAAGKISFGSTGLKTYPLRTASTSSLTLGSTITIARSIAVPAEVVTLSKTLESPPVFALQKVDKYLYIARSGPVVLS